MKKAIVVLSVALFLSICFGVGALETVLEAKRNVEFWKDQVQMYQRVTTFAVNKEAECRNEIDDYFSNGTIIITRKK